MTNFRYSHPESQLTPDSPWSSLSGEAQAALARSALGPAPAQNLSMEGGSKNEAAMSSEVWDWARKELESSVAGRLGLGSWGIYEHHFRDNAPDSLEELAATSPDLEAKLARLYEAQRAISASGYVASDGTDLGKTMHLVLVPWREMHNNLSNFEGWSTSLHEEEGRYANNLSDRLMSAVMANQPLYRGLGQPKSLPSSVYLSCRIAEDGPWGVILAQTSHTPGLKTDDSGLYPASPDQLTSHNLARFELPGVGPVDRMGIFEWTALVLQESPVEPGGVSSWLLANRFQINNPQRLDHGDWFVPACYSRNGGVTHTIGHPDSVVLERYPRLAIV